MKRLFTVGRAFSILFAVALTFTLSAPASAQTRGVSDVLTKVDSTMQTVDRVDYTIQRIGKRLPKRKQKGSSTPTQTGTATVQLPQNTATNNPSGYTLQLPQASAQGQGSIVLTRICGTDTFVFNREGTGGQATKQAQSGRSERPRTVVSPTNAGANAGAGGCVQAQPNTP